MIYVMCQSQGIIETPFTSLSGTSSRAMKCDLELLMRSRNVQGTGINSCGVSDWHYLDLLNGVIDVKSELGIGTEFNITFEQSKASD